MLGLVAQLCAAENQPKVALDNNEALFTVLTAINACGYDSELSLSDPLRAEIRGEVAKTIEASAEAKESTAVMCQFYAEHQQDDPARTLAQYVSLALYLNPPPELALKVKEAELPPDASFVSGFVPPVQKFYGEAGLHAIWMRHQAAYAELIARYHEPLAKVLFDTEVYLKLPSAGFLGRGISRFISIPWDLPGKRTRAITEPITMWSFLPGPTPPQDRSDPAHLSALPAGSAGAKISRCHRVI